MGFCDLILGKTQGLGGDFELGLVGFCGLSLGFCSVGKSLAAYISMDWNRL